MKVKKKFEWDGNIIDIKVGNGIFWGITLLLAAALLIIDALEIFPTLFTLTIWQTIVAVVMLGWIVSSIAKGDFSTIPIALGFLFMVTKGLIADLIEIPSIGEISNWVILLYSIALCIFAKNNIVSLLIVIFTFAVIMLKDWLAVLLNVPQLAEISEWLILACAALIISGLALIFPKFFRKKSFNASSFGDHVRYIDCASFKKAYSKNRFGEYSIYFQNVDSFTSGSKLTLDNKFGTMNVFVPEDWIVESNIHASFGEVNISKGDDGSKVLILEGTNRFGELNVIRKHYANEYTEHFNVVTDYDDDKDDESGNTMERYISCTELEDEYISCNRGVCDVYFTSINDYKGNATLHINNSRSNIKLHIPKDWRVIETVENSRGVNICNCAGGNGPTLNVTGTNSRGVVIIEYHDYNDED